MKERFNPFRGKKIAIVANKPPLSVVEREGQEVLERSVGGLTASLEPLARNLQGQWFCTVKDSDAVLIKSLATLPYSVFPLKLSEEEISRYYEGYANKQLWPLCHSFPTSSFFNEKDWPVYVQVNEKMADLVVRHVDEDTFIWVNDYHFFLLPSLLRKKNPRLQIGFFLHIPFPGEDIFKILANRETLLEGLFGADLIGFHTSLYVKQFFSCVHAVFPGIKQEYNRLLIDHRQVAVQEFPISIDYEKFCERAQSKAVQKKVKELKKAYRTEMVAISVDRLDYSKGPVEKLLAIEHFFDTYPEYCKTISFIQLAVPSRIRIDAYRQLKVEVDTTTGRINGKFALDGWSPIHYIYNTLPIDDLVAHYVLSDLALVLPLRDGLNLVSKEYVACRVNEDGALILSEFAGASEELKEAFLVNPYHKNLVADAIKKAIEMPQEEKRLRMCRLRERVEHHNVFHWMKDYFKAFDAVTTHYTVS
ncbi:MAG: trehalose-6-phosphate synthase [Waddliaceae bacterium]